MAEKPEAQERTEPATPKRLAEAREKGQIPRSRELTTMLLLFCSASILFLSGQHLFGGLADIMRSGFISSKAQIFDVSYLHTAFSQGVGQALTAIMPVFVTVIVIAILAPLAIGGWIVDGTASQFKWERLDPIKGLKRVFGPRGVVEMLKALGKFALILGFALTLLYNRFDTVMALGLSGLERGLGDGATLLLQVFFVASMATIVIALLDVPYQLWDHARNLRMSRQEIKNELKESEGSPELRGRIRSQQQEIATRRMMEKVPQADVVITNPSHYAVALQYDPQKAGAPRVIAKGADLVAQRIREIAEESGVIVMSAPPLARAIFQSTKLGHEVPAGLYLAVAQVLAYVFYIKRAGDGDEHPDPPRDYPIPTAFRF